MSTFLHGVGTVQFLDKSAELVDLKGLDITSLAKTGVINYEHKSDVPAQLVGKILKAKKIFTKEDCSDEHELHFWNKVKVPYLYIMAELLDDYCDSAKHVAGILRYDRDKKEQNEYAIAWFSVEGSEIPGSRAHQQIVSRGIARKVTLTTAPCNQGCAAEILENQKPQIKDDFDEIFKSEKNAIEMLKSDHGIKIYETFLAKKEELLLKNHRGPAAPHNPYAEYENRGIRVGKTKSGKTVYSHGHIGDYGFNPAEHKEAAEHHRRAAVTADNPKLIDNHISRMQLHNNAALTSGRQENRAALSLNDKRKIAAETGKNPVEKSENNLNKAINSPKRTRAGSVHGWSASIGEHGRQGTVATMEHPQHGTVTVHKDKDSGKYHVKHNGAFAGLKGIKGDFPSAGEAVSHAKKYIHAVNSGTTAGKHSYNKPSNPPLSKAQVPGSKYPSKLQNPMGIKQETAGVPKFAPIGAKTSNAPMGLKKALTAGGMNAAPSTLVNGSAYQSENLSSSQANTGAEENKFHATKKKDWNKRAKEDYENWPHKEKFENFMKARMPHLALGEIQAIGRTLALKKTIDLEKSLDFLVSPLKKVKKLI